MYVRPLLLVLAAGLILSACSMPAAQPTATLAPSPTAMPAATARPTATARPAEPTATARPAEPTATARPAEPTEAPALQGLQAADCQFDVPAGYTVNCGLLSVPENRANPSSPMIELAVAVFKSTNPNPQPDPVIYLEGGPGGHALQAIPLTFEDYFAPILDERDLIMFDQRGTGYSKPSLACDEYTKLAYDTLDDNLTLDESTKLFVDAMTACRDRLKGQGIDLTAYNSLASAADLEDLRTTLGYDQWNLYGISYGTRLALTTMREYPDGIRSVILDSTRSLQSSETSTPADVDRSFEKLFDGCAKDDACNKAFPNLSDTFYDLVAKLDTEPITGDVTNPFNGRELKVLINGDSLQGLVTQALYSTDIIPQLPKAIVAASEGVDTSLLMRLALNSVLQNEYVSYGMFYAVRCNEEIVFDTPAALEAADDAFPEQRGIFDLGTYTEICDAWQAGAAPAIENQPVTSDLPTLVLAGEYDPATPPDDGRAAAQTLSNGFFFEFPGLGHGVSVDGGCPQGITLSFLNSPTTKPDDSCIAAMAGPTFVGTGGDIALEEYTNDTFGYTSVIPSGWEEVGPGIFARNSSSDIAILQLALPLGEQETLDRLVLQLNLEGEQAPVGTRTGQALTWKLYEFTVQGLPTDLALASAGQRTFVVMLISDKVERDALYDGLFLPALDAMTPAP
jgi:pimeloyl-ACP methyl ester carboxylesterase